MLEAVADRGYFDGEEILVCEQTGITVTLPKPSGTPAGLPCNFPLPDSPSKRRAVAGGCPSYLRSSKTVAKLGTRPPFHRTRTVAGAAPRARLDKDGSPWRRSPLVSTYRRTASMLPCVQVVKILPSRARVPGSTTSWRVSRC